MENEEKVRKMMKNQGKVMENEENVRKNEGKPMKNQGKVMENKENVRKPCPRQKKKKIPKKEKKKPKKFRTQKKIALPRSIVDDPFVWIVLTFMLLHPCIQTPHTGLHQHEHVNVRI